MHSDHPSKERLEFVFKEYKEVESPIQKLNRIEITSLDFPNPGFVFSK